MRVGSELFENPWAQMAVFVAPGVFVLVVAWLARAASRRWGSQP